MKFQDSCHSLSRDHSLFYSSGHFWGYLHVINSFSETQIEIPYINIPKFSMLYITLLYAIKDKSVLKDKAGLSKCISWQPGDKP